VPAAKTYRFRVLGQRCRELRLEAGLSQLDMTRFHDFSLSHYQKLERGELDPRYSTLKKLAEAFKVSVSQMLKGL
jgi:transcriptional regulator with XRE-family HTH domain